MAEISGTSIVVKYYDVNVTINFSDISTISSPNEAFKRFVDEFFLAFDLIKRLRKMYDETTPSADKQEISELLYSIVTITVDHYGSIQTYLRESREFGEDSDRVQFEEIWGPFVHELRAPTVALKGYIDIIRQGLLPEPYEEKRSEYIAQFDRFLENNLAVLVAYKRHLAGEFDLRQYQGDEIYELISKIKIENNQQNP